MTIQKGIFSELRSPFKFSRTIWNSKKGSVLVSSYFFWSYWIGPLFGQSTLVPPCATRRPSSSSSCRPRRRRRAPWTLCPGWSPSSPWTSWRRCRSGPCRCWEFLEWEGCKEKRERESRVCLCVNFIMSSFGRKGRSRSAQGCYFSGFNSTIRQKQVPGSILNRKDTALYGVDRS